MMRRLLAGLALFLGCLLPPTGRTPARAEVSQLSENQVKAAYLLNFAKYVEWPANAFGSPSTPLVIGIFGKGPIAEASALTGKTVHGRRVQVRQCLRTDEIQGCHLLYIAASERMRLREIQKALPSFGVLTVSDIKQFCSQGGMIGLVTRGEKLQFEVSLGNAERAGFKISSQMLKLALAVYD